MSRAPEFYHGTVHAIAGGKILPGVHDNDDHFGDEYGQVAKHHAFATPDESVAWMFAEQAARQHGGRMRVYSVAPHPKMQPGVFNREHPEYSRNRVADLKEYIAPHYDIAGQQDVMPGRQGTLPHLNWNQFRRADDYSRRDLNHPTPEQFAEERHEARHGDIPHMAHPEQMDLFTGRTVRQTAQEATPEGDKAWIDMNSHVAPVSRARPYGMSEFKDMHKYMKMGPRSRAIWPPER